MSLITLVSGGIDSTLMSFMIKEENIIQYPLFIDYGQNAKEMEWISCKKNHEKHGLPIPQIMEINGFGKSIHSGLTDSTLDIKKNAFLPNRNLLFLLLGSSYAYQLGSHAVAIGLLSDEYYLFPDQTSDFIKLSQDLLSVSLGKNISIITPLIKFSKKHILELAKLKGITETYSCHSGNETPCGKCISCLEIINSK